MLCPSADGKVYFETHRAVRDSQWDLLHSGIDVVELCLAGRSHIQSARETLLWNAWYDLPQRPTHFFWFDSDMDWPMHAVRQLLETDFEFVGAPGLRKQEPYEFCGEFVRVEPERGCIPALGLGFAFVMLKRSVIEKMISAYHDLEWHNSRFNRKEWGLFRDTQDDKDQWLTEDLSFCYRWLKIGGKIWAHLGIELGHIDGTKTYRGRLGDAVANERTGTNP